MLRAATRRDLSDPLKQGKKRIGICNQGLPLGFAQRVKKLTFACRLSWNNHRSSWKLKHVARGRSTIRNKRYTAGVALAIFGLRSAPVRKASYLLRSLRAHTSGYAALRFHTMDSHGLRRSRTGETPWLKLPMQ